MIVKRANFIVSAELMVPLNTPVFKDNIILNQYLKVDTAEVKSTIQKIADQRHATHEKDGVPEESIFFDLEAEIADHPDSLFVKCFAIKADEMNDNGDYFPKNELRRATETFVGVPIFTNHQNSDINQARGKVVHSWWDDDRNGIMIIARIDAEAYPQLARGIREEYVMGTSMGASRGHDLVTLSNRNKIRVDDLQINDLVITHTGKTEPVRAILRTQEHSKLYHIKWSGNSEGLALSYEHPVLILKRENVYKTKNGKQYRNAISFIEKEVEAEFVPASEVKHEDYVLEIKLDSSPDIQKPKFDSFFYRNFIAHKVKDVTVIDNNEPTYYVQIGELEDESSDHSYILNDIATHNCQVKHSICSICHNVAETPQQYCEHIRERKTRTLSAKKQKCAYHKYGKEENCPICGGTKKEANTFDVHEQKVYEYNYGIKFIENSFVVNPACHDCGVTEVIDPQKFLAKVAEIEKRLPIMIKAAAETPVVCADRSCINAVNQKQVDTILGALDFLKKGSDYIAKIAGQEQINDLNQALNLITSVSQDMLKQKDQIDLEFLSDLVKVLADLQGVTDELTEQGYGRLPSPGQQGNVQQPSVGQGKPQTTQPGTPAANPTGGASKIHSGPAGNAGSVTSPLANRKLNLEKLSKDLMSRTILGKSFLLSHQISQNSEHNPGKLLNLKFEVGLK